MKWHNKKREPYSGERQGLKGQKNNVTFLIHDYMKGLGKEHLGWWISISCKKTDRRFNTLWSGLWWQDIEDAKKWCEDFSWDIVPFIGPTKNKP